MTTYSPLTRICLRGRCLSRNTKYHDVIFGKSAHATHICTIMETIRMSFLEKALCSTLYTQLPRKGTYSKWVQSTHPQQSAHKAQVRKRSGALYAQLPRKRTYNEWVQSTHPQQSAHRAQVRKLSGLSPRSGGSLRAEPSLKLGGNHV